MTFRKLLAQVAQAYDEDLTGDGLLCMFDLVTGELIETNIEEQGDTLIVFIVLELKEVIFAPDEFDVERMLTNDEIEAAVAAMGKAEDQLNSVYRAIGSLNPNG